MKASVDHCFLDPCVPELLLDQGERGPDSGELHGDCVAEVVAVLIDNLAVATKVGNGNTRGEFEPIWRELARVSEAYRRTRRARTLRVGCRGDAKLAHLHPPSA